MSKTAKKNEAANPSPFVRGMSGLVSGFAFRGSRPSFRMIDPGTALRGDMQKIGADFYRVVEREHQLEKATSKTAK